MAPCSETAAPRWAPWWSGRARGVKKRRAAKRHPQSNCRSVRGACLEAALEAVPQPLRRGSALARGRVGQSSAAGAPT
eukprot:7092557-Alexandrium_andersonii.AAC.1